MHSKWNLRSSTIRYVLVYITFTSGYIDVDNGSRILDTIEFVTNIHSNTKNKKQREIIRGKKSMLGEEYYRRQKIYTRQKKLYAAT